MRTIVVELTEEQINLLGIAVMEFCAENATEESISMADAVERACHNAERLNA